MFLWILGLGALIYFVMRDDKHIFYSENQSKSILDKRLASGEITPNEYATIMNNMKEK
jgi:uncharacterized membrane protein